MINALRINIGNIDLFFINMHYRNDNHYETADVGQ